MIGDWIRGLALLRHPELVRELGERRLQLQQLAALRAANPGAKLSSGVRLLSFEAGRIRLGAGATVCEGTILSCGDDDNGRGGIEIGAGTWIGQYNNLRAGGGAIRIGRDCLVSQFCTLVASNHATGRSMPIQAQGAAAGRSGVWIGDDVWLGAGCAVLPGARIGNGAVVGANAVVNRNIPDFEIWAGVPARRVGART
jgi:acetyltransferase-like isoleucine patch superfamily enzyme